MARPRIRTSLRIVGALVACVLVTPLTSAPAATKQGPLGPAPAAAKQGCHGKSHATLRIGVFGGSLITMAADAEGFIAEQELTAEYPQVTSSTHQFQGLRDGEYDLVLSAPDNAVNYRLNESNALGAIFDVQIVAGLSHGQNLSLVARPGLDSIDGLRGATAAVDAPDSGFAFVLYKMLREHGLERGSDYEVIVAGGNFARFNALLAGEFDATLLTGGLELRAADAGFPILGAVDDVISPYLGGVALGRERWLRRNCGAVVRLLRAYHRAARWALDAANREQAIDLLMTAPGTARSLAERLYGVQTTPGVGIIGDLGVDRKGLLEVLRLRGEFDGFDQPRNLHRLASPASGLYDESYRRRALRGGGRGDER